MSYLLSEEQQILQDQLRDLLAKRSSPELLRQVISAGAPWSKELWHSLSEMGLHGVTVPECYGGVGLGSMEAGLILEELGRVVAPVPFLSSLLCIEALLIAGSEKQKTSWLPRLATGEVVGTIAWTEGAMAPSIQSVHAGYVEGRLSGRKLPVADAELADICIVVARARGKAQIVLAELKQPGVKVAPLTGIDQLRLQSEITFSDAAAEPMSASDPDRALQQLIDRAAIYTSFEQVGGAHAAIMMARDYTLQRYVFGRQLASFQAVKHKLADIYRRWELAKCNALHGALALNNESADLRSTAATARISAISVYDLAARENLQFHGGIGFTWEADCQFHYRRSRLLALQLGSKEFWADQLVTELEKSRTPVRQQQKENLTEEIGEDVKFRAEVKSWIQEKASILTSDAKDIGERAREWTQLKFTAGYSAIGQPKDLGGAEGTRKQARIFSEEEAHAGLAVSLGAGYHQSMAAIRGHATPAQRQEWETMTNAGKAIWCQLFSEPGAGSDLAAVRTRAIKNGDHWVVNGQKVWTSGGMHADYGILLARTDPDEPKHAGMSFFIIDMRQVGVTVRPIRQINGQSQFTETFLEDAVVPDENRLGEVGEGWSVAMTVLADERNTAGARGNSDGAPRRMSHTSSKSLIEFAKTLHRDAGTAFDSAAVREKIAHFHMEAQGIKSFSRRLLEQLKQGGPPPTNIPVMKLTTTNRLQQIEAFLMDIQEAGGIVQLPGEVEDKFFNYLTSASNRIAGGADEVLLNQLAERELGMPGEVRGDKDVPFSELPY